MKIYYLLFMVFLCLSCNDPVEDEKADSYLFIETFKQYISASNGQTDTTCFTNIDGLNYRYDKELNTIQYYDLPGKGIANSFLFGEKNSWKGDAFNGETGRLRFIEGEQVKDSLFAGSYNPFTVIKLSNDRISVMYKDSLQFFLIPGESRTIIEQYKNEDPYCNYNVTVTCIISNWGRIPSNNVINFYYD